MPAELAPVAVTGATGAVGGRVAALLAGAGVPMLLVVRDARRAPRLPGAEVRATPGYHDRDGMRTALEGAGTVFLVPAGEARDRADQHRAAVDAAVDAGARHLVYLSFTGASPDASFTLAHDHWATEEHVRATGIPFTFLRMNLYMDFLLSMVGEDGVIRGPGGDGRYAGVLREDVAASAAAVLRGDGHAGRTYDLTGPEAYSLAEAAQALGVAYHDETDEEALASRAHHGAPEWEVRGWISSYWAIRSGELATVSDDVRRLTGREPVSLSEWSATVGR